MIFSLTLLSLGLIASKDIKIGICMGELHQAVQLKQLNQYLIPEYILSEQHSPVKHQKPTYQSYSTLKIGDLLVHEDHGVGRYWYGSKNSAWRYTRLCSHHVC